MNETGRALNWFTPARFGILLALLIFAAFPQVILGLQTFVVRDFGFFAYPLAFFQRQCFWHGELPFWDPYNYCGAPFLAQWNTMPLYPPSLIYLLLPLTWSFGFFCLLHLWFGGFGMYFLARRWTGNDFAAAFAGAVFAFNGFTLNLIMWPSHLATFSWMPWVVLAAERAWCNGGRAIFVAAIAGAMQMFAGGPEIILFTWVVVVVCWIQQVARRDSPSLKRFCHLAAVIVLVAALVAAQVLPFFDLVTHSQRQTGYIDTRWSLPLRGWMNFLVPMAFGDTWDMGVFYQYHQEWTSSYYLGIGALWLALLALWKTRNPRVWLLGMVAAAAFVFALGENTFVLPTLRKILPGLRLITHSIKYLAIVIFIAPLLAAFALAHIQTATGERKIALRKSTMVIGAVLLALIGVILFWAAKFPFPYDIVSRTLLNGFSRAGFLLLTGLLLFLIVRGAEGKARQLLPLLLVVTAWADVFTHEPTQNPTVPPWVYQPGLSQAKLDLQPQPMLGQSRAMVTPKAYYKALGFASQNLQDNYLVNRLAAYANCNLLDNLPKVDGFLSLLPNQADDVNTLLYGKTNADYPRLEDFLGVSQISSTNIYSWRARTTFLPLVTAGQKPIYLDDYSAWKLLASSNFDGAGIVALPVNDKSLVTVTNRTDARVLNSKFETQSVEAEVQASEPSLVVFSQSYYHDWRATVDGRPTPLLQADYAFQAVQIPAGRHEIVLAYQDRAFQTGAAISICGWLVCLIGVSFRKRMTI